MRPRLTSAFRPVAVLALTTTALTATALGAGPLPATAAAPPTPDKVTSVRATPGPGVGEITFSWKSRGRHTTSFRIETALTKFSPDRMSAWPRTGRNARVFTVSGKKRSLTLSASQVAAAGAAPRSGNHLYFRLTAADTVKTTTATRAAGGLRAAAARADPPKPRGTLLRVASYNVRTAKSPAPVRPWLVRSPEVAAQIARADPDVVALQELAPSRADGRSGATTKTVPRQTQSLVDRLKRTGQGRYKLVRTTPYVKPGTRHGIQGARILYDTTAVKLLSTCHDTTGKRQYSTSCSFDLPVIKGESRSHTRSAAYADFRSRATGQRFLFVSVHLDHRQSEVPQLAARYNRLRGAQVAAVQAKIKKVRHGGEPVIIAGDFNSWQTSTAGTAPHDYLVGHGYYDTAAAQQQVDLAYPTYNAFATTLTPNAQGYGNRFDQILITGATGARRFTNVVQRVDATRPSDHNLVLADLTL